MAFVAPAQALTMKECSVKFNNAKTAGTLGTTTWNDFRKAQCGTDATPASRLLRRRPRPRLLAGARATTTMAAKAALARRGRRGRSSVPKCHLAEICQ